MESKFGKYRSKLSVTILPCMCWCSCWGLLASTASSLLALFCRVLHSFLRLQGFLLIFPLTDVCVFLKLKFLYQFLKIR